MQAKIKMMQKIKVNKKKELIMFRFKFGILKDIIKKRRNPSRIEKKTQTPEQ